MMKLIGSFFHHRFVRPAITILYWSIVSLLLVLIIRFLTIFPLKTSWLLQKERIQETVFQWREELSNRLFRNLWNLLPSECETVQILSCLQEMEPLSSISCSTHESFYLLHKNGTILSNSELPTGHPNMLPAPFDSIPSYTIPYQRSTDGTWVISFYDSLDQDWVLATDIPLETLSKHLIQSSKSGQFFFLIDTRSSQILAHPDSGYLGHSLEELDDPLFVPLLADKKLPTAPVPAKEKDGTSYYLLAGNSENSDVWILGTYWAVVYGQTSLSLIVQVLFGNIETICLLLFYLMCMGLIWTILWIYVLKERKQ